MLPHEIGLLVSALRAAMQDGDVRMAAHLARQLAERALVTDGMTRDESAALLRMLAGARDWLGGRLSDAELSAVRTHHVIDVQAEPETTALVRVQRS